MTSVNVGSDEAISIGDLAKKVANLIGRGSYEILGKPDMGWNLGAYVPDTDFAATQLGLTRSVSLNQAILKTALWNGWKGSHK